MSDFANLLEREGTRGILNPAGNTPLGDLQMFDETGYADTATTWTANRAVYAPVCARRPVTVTDIIACTVIVQNGNLDVGIYTWNGSRLVSSGSTAVAGALTTQRVGVADTLLQPGWYFLAFASDSATAVFVNSNQTAPKMRLCGYAEQATAFALPATATFATYTTACAPRLAAGYRSVL